MKYLFITSSRGGEMLQDSEWFKYYNKNGLYVCVDNQIVTLIKLPNCHYFCSYIIVNARKLLMLLFICSYQTVPFIINI